jgi:hypothetical protein
VRDTLSEPQLICPTVGKVIETHEKKDAGPLGQINICAVADVIRGSFNRYIPDGENIDLVHFNGFSSPSMNEVKIQK